LQTRDGVVVVWFRRESRRQPLCTEQRGERRQKHGANHHGQSPGQAAYRIAAAFG
jgi:hypothetical protein